MPVFTPPNIITDPTVLAANAKAKLESELPGWRAEPGSIEDLLIDTLSLPAAEQNEALELEVINAYRSLGGLIGVEPLRATPASGTATFTVIDTLGHTLHAAETVLGLRTPTNELQTFRLVSDLVIAPGSSTGSGLVQATEPGSAGNNLVGVAELIEAPEALTGATVATTGNGTDEELESVFLDRLTEELAIQKPGPVLAEDAAPIARSVAGVFRAAAVDNLSPSAADGGEGVEETNVEKCVTVACVDEQGKPCSAEVLAAADALLQMLRELNFKFFVIKPHYTKIDVTVVASAWPGQNVTAVKEVINEALTAALSPARWATDSTRRSTTWENNPIVRLGDLVRAVGDVAGVRWVSSLTFGEHGKTLGTANVTLGAGSAVPALPDVDGSADGTKTAATFTITVEPTT